MKFIINNKGKAKLGSKKLQNYFATGNYSGLKEFYTYPYVYGADYDIRAWYRYKWTQEFDNNRPKNLTKGFLDIEVDTLESVGMPDPVFNPVDLVTLIDRTTKTSYTFSLLSSSILFYNYLDRSVLHPHSENILLDTHRSRLLFLFLCDRYALLYYLCM